VSTDALPERARHAVGLANHMTSESEDSPRYGCATCWPESADLAWEARQRVKFETNLVDESHFSMSILRCPECRQAFLSVFMESIDWADGDDPQYLSVMPLEDLELKHLTSTPVSMHDLKSMAPDRRSLFRASPKGVVQSNSWASGIVFVFHG
jgi:hypothetical protein